MMRAYMLHDLKSQGFHRSIELIGSSRNFNGVFCKNLGTIDAFPAGIQEFLSNPDATYLILKYVLHSSL